MPLREVGNCIAIIKDTDYQRVTIIDKEYTDESVHIPPKQITLYSQNLIGELEDIVEDLKKLHPIRKGRGNDPAS